MDGVGGGGRIWICIYFGWYWGVIFEKSEAGILGGLMYDGVIVVQEITLWEYEM